MNSDILFSPRSAILHSVALVCFALLNSGCNQSTETPNLPQFAREEVSVEVQRKLKTLEDRVRAEPTAANWSELGMFYWAHYANEPARECFRQSLALDPDDLARRYYLARLYEEVDWEQAAEQYAKAEALPENYAPMFVRYGDLLMQLDRPAEAKSHYEQASRLEPQSALPLIGLARAAAAEDDAVAERRFYSDAVKADPQCRQAWTGLAQSFRREGLLTEAFDAYRKASRLPVSEAGMPDKLYVRVQKMEVVSRRESMTADQLMMAGQWKEASAAFGRLIEKQPQWSRARLGLAQSYLRMGESSKAEKVLLETVKAFPNEVDAYELLAAVYESQSQWNAAEKAYGKCVELQPGRASSHFAMGLLFERRDDLAGATESYRQAVNASPQFAPAQLSLGVALMRQAKPNEGLPYIRNAVHLAPGDPLPRQFLRRAETEAKAAAARETKEGKANEDPKEGESNP